MGADSLVEVLTKCCPYGKLGDLLWVRETHYRWTGCGDAPIRWVESPDGDRFQARAYSDDPEIKGIICSAECVTVPSIHMPRWASRLALRITSVRVERVQDISEDDAYSEGYEHQSFYRELDQRERTARMARLSGIGPSTPAHKWFAELWDTINAARGYSWESNPWCWCIEFEPIHENIDRVIERETS